MTIGIIIGQLCSLTAFIFRVILTKLTFSVRSVAFIWFAYQMNANIWVLYALPVCLNAERSRRHENYAKFVDLEAVCRKIIFNSGYLLSSIVSSDIGNGLSHKAECILTIKAKWLLMTVFNDCECCLTNNQGNAMPFAIIHSYFGRRSKVKS